VKAVCATESRITWFLIRITRVSRALVAISREHFALIVGIPSKRLHAEGLGYSCSAQALARCKCGQRPVGNSIFGLPPHAQFRGNPYSCSVCVAPPL